MAILHAPLAARATFDGDVEFAVHRFDLQNFSLILFRRFHELHPAAAERAFFRQWRSVNFVDARRHGAKGFGTVVVAAFATGRFGIDLGRAFGKRRVRAVLLAAQFLDQRAQLLDLRGLHANQRPQPLIFCAQRFIHAERIVTSRKKNEWKALNNYP